MFSTDHNELGSFPLEEMSQQEILSTTGGTRGDTATILASIGSSVIVALVLTYVYKPNFLSCCFPIGQGLAPAPHAVIKENLDLMEEVRKEAANEPMVYYRENKGLDFIVKVEDKLFQRIRKQHGLIMYHNQKYGHSIENEWDLKWGRLSVLNDNENIYQEAIEKNIPCLKAVYDENEVAIETHVKNCNYLENGVKERPVLEPSSPEGKIDFKANNLHDSNEGINADELSFTGPGILSISNEIDLWAKKYNNPDKKINILQATSAVISIKNDDLCSDASLHNFLCHRASDSPALILNQKAPVQVIEPNETNEVFKEKMEAHIEELNTIYDYNRHVAAKHAKDCEGRHK